VNWVAGRVVLVQSGAGAVGAWAVQRARWAGGKGNRGAAGQEHANVVSRASRRAALPAQQRRRSVMLLAAESEVSGLSLAGGLISLPALIAVNAVFVAAQFALVALRQTRVEEMKKQGVPGAKAVAAAMDNLDRCVAATQLGTVLAGLLLGWLGEPAVAALLQPLFDRLFDAQHYTAFRSATAVLTFLIITFLSVVFGELIPKTIGLQNSEGAALVVARPLLFFTYLTRPLIHLMDGAGNLILRLVGYNPVGDADKPHSVGELTLLIQDSAEAGILTANQAKFVTNLLHISEKKVADVLLPIDKVGLIELGCEPEAVLRQVNEGTFTRMPVYQGSRDNILGVANTKQLLRAFTTTGRVALEEVIYPALFVAPSDTLPKAMRVLRDAHFPLALVRDSAGKVVGIFTLEDGLEQIIGDIIDEHDYPAPRVTPRLCQAFAKVLTQRKPGAAMSPGDVK
jgi:putative hemolysin